MAKRTSHPLKRLGGAYCSLETRVGRKIRPLPNGCWQYGESLHERRVVKLADRSTVMHRFVYETLIGPIPEGQELHHECENRGCVNPAHLVPLTHAEHMARHAEMRRVAAA